MPNMETPSLARIGILLKDGNKIWCNQLIPFDIARKTTNAMAMMIKDRQEHPVILPEPAWGQKDQEINGNLISDVFYATETSTYLVPVGN